MSDRRSTTKGQQGVSLIEAILAIGFVGILLTALMQFSRHGRSVNYRLQELEAKEDARSAVLNRLDCNMTLAATPGCTGNPTVTLLDSSGNALTDASGMIGPWKLDAQCTAGQGIQVQGTYTGNLTAEVASVGSKGPLFKSGVSFCREYSAPSPPLIQKATVALANSGIKCLGNDINPNAVRWQGIATCPAGYFASGGGVDCGSSQNTMEGAWPTSLGTGNGWAGSCCVLPATFPAATVSVTCVLDD